MTCVSHLPGQQVCKSNSILSCVVVTVLFVRQECVCCLLRNLPIKVVLLQVLNDARNYPLPFRRIEACVHHCFANGSRIWRRGLIETLNHGFD